MTTTSECEFATVSEAARRLRISQRTLREKLQRGEIEAFQISGRWRIPTASLDAWIDGQLAARRA